MAAGFEYFDSTQAGAPVLHGAAGRLIAVLDWVLVSKGGWTKPFTGTNLAAYRSDTGNRFYLRVDDTQATYTRTRAYRSMTAVSTGTSQFPTSTQAGNINTWGIRKAYDASDATDIQKYWGIRTNRYLVLFVETISETDFSSQGVSYRAWLVFGDVPSLCEADAHNTVICAQYSADNTYSMYRDSSMTSVPLEPSYAYDVTSVGVAVSGTPDGTVVSPLSGAHFPYYPSAPSYADSLAMSNRMFFSPVLVGSTSSPTNNAVGVFPRATLPNVHAIYGPCADTIPDSRLPATDLVPLTIGARQFLPLLPAVSYQGSFTEAAVMLEKTDTSGAL